MARNWTGAPHTRYKPCCDGTRAGGLLPFASYSPARRPHAAALQAGACHQQQPTNDQRTQFALPTQGPLSLDRMQKHLRGKLHHHHAHAQTHTPLFYSCMNASSSQRSMPSPADAALGCGILHPCWHVACCLIKATARCATTNITTNITTRREKTDASGCKAHARMSEQNVGLHAHRCSSPNLLGAKTACQRRLQHRTPTTSSTSSLLLCKAKRWHKHTADASAWFIRSQLGWGPTFSRLAHQDGRWACCRGLQQLPVGSWPCSGPSCARLPAVADTTFASG